MADIQMTGSPAGYGAQGTFHDAQQTAAGTAKGNGAGFSTYANAAGAVVSLALMVGVGIWGYQLLVRDVSGVPVVRATEGPWRVAPENPGGEAADHQGLAVNEVAGRGSASGPVDRVALAPHPVGLEEEDVTAPALNTVPVLPGFSDDTAPEEDSTVMAAMTAEEDKADAARAPATIMTNRIEKGAPQRPISNATIQALADQIAADVQPLSAAAPAAAAPVRTEVKPVEAASPVIDAPGVRRSLRPRTRPAQLVQASARAAAAAPVETAASAALDPVSLPAGTRLVQLGAYESPAIAEREWTRIAGTFDSFFDGKARVIQKAQSGGRTFYRLRAHGFEDLADARRFCALLVAEGPDCIPVITK